MESLSPRKAGRAEGSFRDILTVSRQQMTVTMSTTRRDFLHASATAGVGLALRPGASKAAADSAAGIGRPDDKSVKAFEQRMLRARPLALDRVRVLGGPLKQAQDLTANCLLSLEPDRMLAF